MHPIKIPHIVIQIVWTIKSYAKPGFVVVIFDEVILELHLAAGMVLKLILFGESSHPDLRTCLATILVAFFATKEVALPLQEPRITFIAFYIFWKGQPLQFGHDVAIRAANQLLLREDFIQLKVPLLGERESADVVSQVLGQHATVLAFVIATIVGDEILVCDHTAVAIEF